MSIFSGIDGESRLTFLRQVKPAVRGKNGLFKCACGAEILANRSKVKRGHTRSCGCFKLDNTRALKTTHGAARKGAKAPEYLIWQQIKARCFKTYASNYGRYGARGITLAPEWVDDYAAFITHVGPRPSPDHSIDRINNDGNYEPGNVRWATREQQARNRTTSRKITIGGETLVLVDWAARVGVDRRTVWNRIVNLGWDPARAVMEPVPQKGVGANV
jgi:hypothetical protein